MATLFIPVVFAVLHIVTLTSLGYYLRVKNKLSTDFFNQLNEFLARSALPLYYFSRVSRTNVDDVVSSLFFPVAAVGIILLTALVSWAFFSALRYSGTLKNTAIALAVFGNSGFIPLFFAELFPGTIPVFKERFGVSTPLLYIGTYMLVASPVLWSVGNYLCAGSAEKIKARNLLNPPVYGIIAGLAVTILGIQPYLFNERLPFFHIYSAIYSIGSVVPPLLLLCLGASIANLKGLPRDNAKELVRVAAHVSVVRFIFIPALFFGIYFLILRPLSLSPAHYWVIFLQMVIPPATSIAVLAARGKRNEDHVGFTLLATYLLYIVVLPLFLLLFISLPGTMK
jgi:predicted permease